MGRYILGYTSNQSPLAYHLGNKKSREPHVLTIEGYIFDVFGFIIMTNKKGSKGVAASTQISLYGNSSRLREIYNPHFPSFTTHTEFSGLKVNTRAIKRG